jgi:hypothetical protein
MIDVETLFEIHESEYMKFDRIENKLHHRPDICAFLLLDSIVPNSGDMISAAEHDEIFLDTSCDDFAERGTEDDVITLLRCGITYSGEYDCFRMMV